MQALLFEMKPRDGHEDHYFRHAERLRPFLLQQEGLIFIERFKALAQPGVILSHSLWRDEASIAKWRTDQEHHKSQTAGRLQHFEDYRIPLWTANIEIPISEWTAQFVWIPDQTYDQVLVPGSGAAYEFSSPLIKTIFTFS